MVDSLCKRARMGGPKLLNPACDGPVHSGTVGCLFRHLRPKYGHCDVRRHTNLSVSFIYVFHTPIPPLVPQTAIFIAYKQLFYLKRVFLPFFGGYGLLCLSTTDTQALNSIQMSPRYELKNASSGGRCAHDDTLHKHAENGRYRCVLAC